MKITDIKYEKLLIPLKVPFVTALGTDYNMDVVLVKVVTDEGVYGIGEAAPCPDVTGDTSETVIIAINMMKQRIIGMNPLDIEGIHRVMNETMVFNSSAKCAIDLALYDILGKIQGQPLYKLLGGESNHIVSDVTIGIDKPENMAAEAKGYVDQGYRILKIKCGVSPEDDIRAVKLIRETVGSGIRLRVDANQGYDVETSLMMLPKFKALGVDAAEQPLPYWDIEGMASVREKCSDIKLMADESLHNIYDAMRMCKVRSADTFNIKLMKCGGLYQALKINDIAESYGVNCMVGCMFETKIAITAALSLVASRKNITEADCDSFLFSKDPEMGMTGGFTHKGSDFYLTDRPGIGVDYDF